jgi:hypothetical protein
MCKRAVKKALRETGFVKTISKLILANLYIKPFSLSKQLKTSQKSKLIENKTNY